MDAIRSLHEVFQYDTTLVMNTRQFFHNYRNDFPMLGIFIGGLDGDTQFDCFDNLQVFRVHGFSSQPRVIARDSRQKYLSIPVKTHVKFKVIHGHTSVGKMQVLPDILKAHKLPVLVATACDPKQDFKIGTRKYLAKEFGNILIENTYTEYFLLLNLIDETVLNLRSHISLAALTNDLTVAPITGFKLKACGNFQAYLKTLEQQAAASYLDYDFTCGNPEFIEYDSLDEAGMTRNGQTDRVEENVYEELRPLLPQRCHDLPVPGTDKKNETRTSGPVNREHNFGKHKESKVTSSKTSKEEKKHFAVVNTKDQSTDEHRKAPLKVVHGVGYDTPVTPPKVFRPKLTTSIETNDVNTADVKKDSSYLNLTIGRATVRPFSPEADRVTSPLSTVDANRKHDSDDNIVNIQLPERNVFHRNVDLEDKDYLVPYEDPLERIPHSDKDQAYYHLSGDSNDVLSQLKDDKTMEGRDNEQTNRNIKNLKIKDVGDVLERLSLGQYTEAFEKDQIDGEMLSCLSTEDFIKELHMTRLEALRLHNFVKCGHIPR